MSPVEDPATELPVLGGVEGAEVAEVVHIVPVPAADSVPEHTLLKRFCTSVLVSKHTGGQYEGTWLFPRELGRMHECLSL